MGSTNIYINTFNSAFNSHSSFVQYAENIYTYVCISSLTYIRFKDKKDHLYKHLCYARFSIYEHIHIHIQYVYIISILCIRAVYICKSIYIYFTHSRVMLPLHYLLGSTLSDVQASRIYASASYHSFTGANASLLSHRNSNHSSESTSAGCGLPDI